MLARGVERGELLCVGLCTIFVSSPMGDETKGVGLGVGLDLETRLGTERRREIDQVDLLEGRPW